MVILLYVEERKFLMRCLQLCQEKIIPLGILLNLHNYFNLHVCPSIPRRCRHRHVPLLIFQFLLSYYKVSLIKAAWYVLRLKNIHSWSSQDPLGPWDEKKPSYILYDIRREEAKLRILKLASVFHHLPSVSPKQLCALAHIGCTRFLVTMKSQMC